MQPWKTTVICAGKYRPRQFEYHPLHEDVLVFGTLKGEAVVADIVTNSVWSTISSGLARDRHDSILGLCWLKRSPSRFVVGSSHGYLRLCDSGPLPPAGGRNHDGLDQLRNRSGAVKEADTPFAATRAAVVRPMEGGTAGGDNGAGSGDGNRNSSANFLEGGRVVSEFDPFQRLTSVHVNSTDDHMLASGYTFGVRLFDIETKQVVRDFKDIHQDHINISRFANHSPFIFATSSFDKTVKAWDSRVRADKAPIYTCHSERGHVMLSFSPDDVFLLTSAVDNEIKQYLTVDGRLHMDLDVPKTGLEENYTRSYYTSSGRLILSGSSEEQIVRLYCAQTGRLIHSAEMYPGRKHGSLYVQSLRGDPHHDFQFSVLVNYRDTAYPLEIVTVDMLQGNNGEDLSSLMTYTSSSRLSADLGRACVEKEGADVHLVSRDRSRFSAHKAILACRSPVLSSLLAASAATSAEPSTEEAKVARTFGEEMGHTGTLGGQAAVAVERQERNEMQGNRTEKHAGSSRADVSLNTVCLPRAVAPHVVPIILAFLYTDRFETYPENVPDGFAESYVDPGGAATATHAEEGGATAAGQVWSMLGRGIVSTGAGGGYCDHDNDDCGGEGQARAEAVVQVNLCENVLQAAKALGLERLSTLVEWHCRGLVDNVTAVEVASMALRQGAQQLLKFCVHYLGTYLKMVYELHGRDCLPPPIQAKVDAEKQHRLYALTREPSKNTAAPEATSGSPQPPATTTNFTAAPPPAPNAAGPAQPAPAASPPAAVGAGAGGNALNSVLAVATAAASAAVQAALPRALMGGGVLPQAWGGGGAGAGVETAAAGGGEQGDGGNLDPMNDDQDDDDSDGEWDAEQGMDDDDGDSDDTGDEEDGDNEGFVDEEVEEEGTSDGGSSSDSQYDDDDDDDDGDDDDDDDDDDEGPWVHPDHDGGILPGIVRRRLVPTVTGHTASTVLGAQMLVLGGGNKRQFHSCRHVLMYDPIERTWSKLSTRGTAPQTLIYHSASPLEPPWAYPRNLLVFGGNMRSASSEPSPPAQVLVLDSLTMRWSRPVVEGGLIGLRTRHSAVSVHADYAEYTQARESTPDDKLVDRFADLNCTELHATAPGERGGFPEGQECGSKRDHARCAASSSCCYRRDLRGDTDIILFGGYSPVEEQAYDDVLVLNVQRTLSGSSSLRHSSTSVNSDSGENMDDSGSARRRRRHSAGNHPVWGEFSSDVRDGDDGSDSDVVDGRGGAEEVRNTHGCYSCVNPNATTSPNNVHAGRVGMDMENDSSGLGVGAAGGGSGGGPGKGKGRTRNRERSHSSYGYRYRWIRPAVRGTPPTRRLAHAAAVVRLMDGELDGSEGAAACIGTETYMVVFGGVGTGAIYNDVHVLRCGNINMLQWEPRIHVRGRPPLKRYGHSMLTLSPPSSANCGYAKLAVFGGTSGHHAFSDVFIMTMSWGKVAGQSALTVEWEALAKNMTGVLPCPRSRQTMCQINGELIVFGGSDEWPATDPDHIRSREVDTHVYHIRPRLKRRPLPLADYPGAGQSKSLGVELALSQQGVDGEVPDFSSGSSPRQWHERAMAREVSNAAPLVAAAEKRRAIASATRSVMVLTAPPAATATAASAAGSSALLATGQPSQRQAGHTYGATAMAEPEKSSGLAKVPRVTNTVNRSPLPGRGPTMPSRARDGGMDGREVCRIVLPKKSTKKPQFGIRVVWESIRPDTFVYEPGPEPAVVVKPMTLHKDMHSLVGNPRFSDIQFRFQAVDFNLPTTPTNTAHYAIVPPPTPPPPLPRHQHQHQEEVAAATTSSWSKPCVQSPSSTPEALPATRFWRDTCTQDKDMDHSAAAADDYYKNPSNRTIMSFSGSGSGSSAAARSNTRSGGVGTTEGGARSVVAAGEANSTLSAPVSAGSGSDVGETTVVTGRSLSGAGGSRVVGDEEGISAEESRSARRAHRSALLSFPEAMSPRSSTGTSGRATTNNDGSVPPSRAAAAAACASSSGNTNISTTTSSCSPLVGSGAFGGGCHPRSALPVLPDSPLCASGLKSPSGVDINSAGHHTDGVVGRNRSSGSAVVKSVWGSEPDEKEKRREEGEGERKSRSWVLVASGVTTTAGRDGDRDVGMVPGAGVLTVDTTIAGVPVATRLSQHNVVTRSSAGQELGSPRALSPVANVFPKIDHSKLGRANSFSTSPRAATPGAFSPRCGKAGGGSRRRFFGLSEAAEAEAEAAAASSVDDRRCSVGGAGRDEDAHGERERRPTPLPGRLSVSSCEDGRGGEVIDAHRMVVSLRSEPMRAMLRSGMRETFATEALVKDIRAPVFSALLTYLYTDTLQLERPEDIMELLVVANQYTLNELVSLCEGFLQGVLDTENAAHLYHYADALGMHTFEHRLLTFVIQHWGKISSLEDWKLLPEELKERANTFRTTRVHLFMLGQQDHVAWKTKGREMAPWVYERTWAEPADTELSWPRDAYMKNEESDNDTYTKLTEESRTCEERSQGANGTAGQRMVVDGDEDWMTASEGESEGEVQEAMAVAGMSDEDTGAAPAVFFSPQGSQSAGSDY